MSADVPPRPTALAAVASAMLLSQIGSQAQGVALSWQLYALTRDPWQLAMFGLARAAPLVCLAPWGGAVADRVDRRRLWLCTQLAAAVAACALALLAYRQPLGVATAYGWAAWTGAVSSLETPARRAYFPSLVGADGLSRAIALGLLGQQVATAAGPIIGGSLIAAHVAWAAHALSAGGLCAVAAVLVALRPERVPAPPRARAEAVNVRAGLAYVYGHGLLRGAMVRDFFAGFFARCTVLLPMLARERYDVGAAVYGLLVAAPGLGAALGAAWQARANAASAASAAGHGRRGAYLAGGLALVGLAATPSWLAATACLGLFGAAQASAAIGRHRARHAAAPARWRGRVHGVGLMAAHSGPRLGEVAAGTLAGSVGMASVIFCGGVGFASLALRGRARPVGATLRPRPRPAQ